MNSVKSTLVKINKVMYNTGAAPESTVRVSWVHTPIKSHKKKNYCVSNKNDLKFFRDLVKFTLSSSSGKESYSEIN